MAEEIPRRLPENFIWSSSGQRHVDYTEGESFEGELGTYLGRNDLGDGGQATVSVVVVKGKAVARKRMNTAGVNDEARREAHILASIVHVHIIQLVGTYTQNLRLYLLLYPIAECTMREYVTRPIDLRNQIWERQLSESFGCLANSIAFLHSKRVAIKHKDIKPSNILMFRGSAILTDFGISNSFKDKDHSTSTGFTKRSTAYAAPEVIHHEKRNTSQDIFSLGLVYLDMYWALLGKTQSRSDFNGEQREGHYPGTILDKQDSIFAGNVVKLGFEHSPSFQGTTTFLRLIRLMTAVSRSQRPSADTIWNVLTNPTYFGQTCGNCCLPEHTDKTAFTEWSGLHTYVPNRPRMPFDYQSDHGSSSEITLHPSDDMKMPQVPYIDASEMPPTFDWTGQGRSFHVDFGLEEEVPTHSVRVLGYGAFAIVEAVKCNGKLLARKTVRTARRVTRADVEKEVAILLRLEHRHTLRVVGSYTTGRSFSILLYPACEWNLRDLLAECRELRSTDKGRQRARTIRIMLKRSTQCLAQALEYIHEKNVRHADIKPTNILYRMVGEEVLAHVYLADFGISKLVDDLTDTRTKGPIAFSLKYAPSETIHQDLRGRAIDVFSLGCVFYEILATLLCKDLRSDGYRFNQYSKEVVNFHSAVQELRSHNGVAEGLRIPRGQISRFADLIVQMTQEQPEDRPLAVEVALRLGANECCYLEPETVGDNRDFNDHQNTEGTNT